MFRGHWIVADMDGTLTPTPTRADGKYLTLSHCMQTGLGYGARYKSCLAWLRLFLQCGGTLCVVSTAGRRMWSQLYPDLAPALFRLRAAAAAGATAAGCDRAPPGPSPPIDSSDAPGTLYLCGFTGAALFRSRPWEAVWSDMDRLHPHWRMPSAPHPSRFDEGDGRCRGETAVAVAMVPPAGVALEEWTEYREQGAVPDAGSQAAGNSAVSRLATMDAAACVLARDEGRQALVRFFEHASHVCGHDAARAKDFFAACLSTKYHSVFADLLQQLLAEAHVAAPRGGDDTFDADAGTPHVCFAASKVLSPTALAQHGFFLQETGDALVDAQLVPRADGTVAEGAAVAQVVVMGIPMRFFDQVFPRAGSSSDNPPATSRSWHCCPRCAAAGAGARQRLEAAGLELKSQPNSACLHRYGVDKATCVRWLLAQHEQHQLVFELSQALAFGDMPESVDAPLTAFPPMQFISLSPKDGAAARLADIERAAVAGSTSADSTGSRGLRQQQHQQLRCLSDSAQYMFHVGGEEEGTALFLEELLGSCMSEQQQEERRRGAAPSSRDAADAARVVNWFTADRVAASATRARRRMEEELLQREQHSTASA
ncbi:hypothetical protein, unknown function [Leishmania mexicana MHOM/GT/2001/U1103]|uniref:Uncharacterized protein n=1 Tax=Leishmania mexicana (strain MHOM/GT/2001/U1103) TaxID=929439 RepID=E9AQN4_LEIMU|nr:hypothetical protein, unknown function [Leishmania mexicana MHOM/GT/2001/U1103]CBZ25253.1 hypothetical protein, unknown function [Leishmania mexicana MHOM/GT/2001/U1103]